MFYTRKYVYICEQEISKNMFCKINNAGSPGGGKTNLINIGEQYQYDFAFYPTVSPRPYCPLEAVCLQFDFVPPRPGGGLCVTFSENKNSTLPTSFYFVPDDATKTVVSSGKYYRGAPQPCSD